MIDLIPLENSESVADRNEIVIPKSARKTPRRQRQTGIMQKMLCKKMNKIAFGRTIDKCLNTTDLHYLTNFDLKVFLRQVPKLHHYTDPKNWYNFGTWFGVTTVFESYY